MMSNDQLDFNLMSITSQLDALIGSEERREIEIGAVANPTELVAERRQHECEIVQNTANNSPPKFEFHYLSSFNTRNPNGEAVPLISNAPVISNGLKIDRGSAGCFGGQQRKFQKPVQKANKQESNESRGQSKAVRNSDSVPFGLGADGKERNAVVRIFRLFYQMHYYLNDLLPSAHAMTIAQYFSLVPPVRASLPATMNVQFQVKQAVRKCTIFLCDQERIINANKLFDRNMYHKCERVLQTLRRLLSQFEEYKHMKMEHKRGQFTVEAKRVAKLEQLMTEINNHIREANIVVHVFDWAMSVKHNKPPIRRPLHISTSQQALLRELENNTAVNCAPAGYERANLLVGIIKDVYAEQMAKVAANGNNNCNEDDSAERDPKRYVG